ncbi:MAG: thiamine diphosphokinase [Treponema sp.]|jgi:thiamine pyrophosphokinase|nr:thiamine diphosphokinase [Treponema sp.]
MRGIAFIGGDGPRPEFCRRLLGALGAPALIAAADSGLEAAEAAGLRPDWVLGDMDSLGDLSRLDAYPPGRVLRYRAEKDCSDTELALRLLWEKGCGEVWLIGGGGGRLDHLLAIRALFERDPRPSRWITAAEDVRHAASPSRTRWSGPPGSLVSVFPLGAGPWEAESAGLKWQLAGLPWDRGFFGLSNVAENGRFSLRARRGRFLVVLPLPAQDF